MRRRWRVREHDALAGPPFGEDVPSWSTQGPEQWSDGWADPTPAPAPTPAAAPAIDISGDLLRVLEAVTTMCGHVIGFVEADREERRLAMQADRAERRAMLDTLSLLVGRIGDAPAIPAPPRERVVGGSMPVGPESLIDLRALEDASEVCCRRGDRWLDGFEIGEKVEDDFGVRYRLRRRTDGVMLPELFAASDIRPAASFEAINTFDELSATAVQQGNWSPARAPTDGGAPESAGHEDTDRSPTPH
jgi:hypothetical protein